jgi:hypothetical protein
MTELEQKVRCLGDLLDCGPCPHIRLSSAHRAGAVCLLRTVQPDPLQIVVSCVVLAHEENIEVTGQPVRLDVRMRIKVRACSLS